MPTLPPQGPSAASHNQEAVSDYLTGLRSTRKARALFVTLVSLALVFHIGAFVGVMWAGFLDGSGDHSAPFVPDPVMPDSRVIPSLTSATPLTSASSPQFHLVQDRQEEPQSATPRALDLNWRKILPIGLPLSEFIAQISTAMMFIVFTLAALLASAGRLSGAGSFVSAALRAALAFALIFPWSRYLSGIQIPGVFLSWSEIATLDRAPIGLDQFITYARFLGYPLLVLIIVLMASGKFSRGYRRLRQHVQAQLQTGAI